MLVFRRRGGGDGGWGGRGSARSGGAAKFEVRRLVYFLAKSSLIRYAHRERRPASKLVHTTLLSPPLDSLSPPFRACTTKRPLFHRVDLLPFFYRTFLSYLYRECALGSLGTIRLYNPQYDYHPNPSAREKDGGRERTGTSDIRERGKGEEGRRFGRTLPGFLRVQCPLQATTLVRKHAREET